MDSTPWFLILAAQYLANKPAGWPAVELIVAVTLFTIAATWAAWTRDPWRALISVALGALALALLSPV